MEIVIRNMVAADIEQIRHIATTSWHDTYKHSIPVDIQTNFLQRTYSNEALLERLENSHFFVAQIANQIVGFANLSLPDAKQQVELGALYLLPSKKRKGVGSKLLKIGIKRIGKVKQVLVHVEKHNQAALQFYKQKGFVCIKEFDELFYNHPLQTIQLMLYVSE